jgi:hypothetical protein
LFLRVFTSWPSISSGFLFYHTLFPCPSNLVMWLFLNRTGMPPLGQRSTCIILSPLQVFTQMSHSMIWLSHIRDTHTCTHKHTYRHSILLLALFSSSSLLHQCFFRCVSPSLDYKLHWCGEFYLFWLVVFPNLNQGYGGIHSWFSKYLRSDWMIINI